VCVECSEEASYDFLQEILATSQARGRFYNITHVSGVHHQRRNNVAHKVEKGRENLRMCQWKIRKMQRMDKMLSFRTCGSLILSNLVLEWSLQGSEHSVRFLGYVRYNHGSF